MIAREKGNIRWLEFHLFQSFPEVIHGIFLCPLDFTEPQSKKEISNALGLSQIIHASQVHGCHLEIASKNTLFECDGLLSDQEDMGLLINHADCQVAIFFDLVQKVIGNVHCGWRGSVQNIYSKTVEKFQTHFGSKVEDLLVCISPSLGPKHAEFIHHSIELPVSFLPFQEKHNHFNFWEISRMQLLNAGILKKNIEIANLCTFSQKGNFFSYRRDKKSERNGTVVALNLSKPVSKEKRQ